MYERSIKGVRYQLWGLNILVLALVLLSMILGAASGFLTFALALGMLLLSGIGLVMFIIGSIFHILGARELGNTTMVVVSLLMFILAPFIFISGMIMMPPVNLIIIHIALWLLLASPTMPYMKLGGIFPGFLAVLSQTVLLIYTLMIALYAQVGVNIPVVIGILAVYFLFVEMSMIISYIRLKRKHSGPEVTEGLASGAGEIDTVERRGAPIPKDPNFDTASKPEEKRSFKVLEFEFSTSSSRPDRTFEQIPGRAPQRRKKGPVVGKVLDLEKILFNTSSPKKEHEKESYTVLEEEEIYISMEDLFIDGQDLYHILKVPLTASSKEIKKAYRKRALLFHPDKNRDTGPLYAETIGREMRKVNKAKEILLDPARRSLYDSLLKK